MIFDKRTQAHAWSQIRQQFKQWVETPNGPGSTLDATQNVRTWLPQIIKDYGIKSMLDIPCGDWNWMQHTNISGLERYIGWDVEPEQVAINDDEFGGVWGDGVDVRFECVNILDRPQIPDVDLIWCRDLMIHLPTPQNQRIVQLFRDSGVKYLAASTAPWVTSNEFQYDEEGHDGRPGYWCHPVNLEIAPFGLTNVLARMNEVEPRQMVLFG